MPREILTPHVAENMVEARPVLDVRDPDSAVREKSFVTFCRFWIFSVGREIGNGHPSFPSQEGGCATSYQRRGVLPEDLRLVSRAEPPRLRLSNDASRHFIDGAATPPNLGGEFLLAKLRRTT